MQKMERMTPKGLVVGLEAEKPQPKVVEEKKVEEVVEDKPKRSYNKKK